MELKINDRVINIHMNIDDETEEYLIKALSEYEQLKKENEKLKEKIKHCADVAEYINPKIHQLTKDKQEAMDILKKISNNVCRYIGDRHITDRYIIDAKFISEVRRFVNLNNA